MDNKKMLFYFLMGMSVIGLGLSITLISYLRKNHVSTWKRLGSLSPIMNNSIQNNLLFQKFIWKKEYLKLNDKKLNLLAGITRYLLVLYILLFVGLVFSMFVYK